MRLFGFPFSHIVAHPEIQCMLTIDVCKLKALEN